MDQELRDALLAARDGDEPRARLILAEYLRRDPDNVAAWVLLSKLAPSNGQKAAFLRKVLDLDPSHAYAREALQQLGQAPAPVVADHMEPAAAQIDEPAPQTGEPAYSEAEEIEEPIAPFDFDLEEPTVQTSAYAEDTFLETDYEEPIPPETGLDPIEQDQFDAMPEDMNAMDEDLWHVSEMPEEVAAQEGDEEIPSWVDVDAPMFEASDVDEAPDEDLPEWLLEEGAAEWLDEEAEARQAQREQTLSAAEEADASTREAKLSAAMSKQQPRLVTDVEEEGGLNWMLMALIIVAIITFLALVYVILTTFL